jgi:hypothetical protein
MKDSTQWSERESRRLLEHIVRTSARLDSLAGRYGELRTLLIPGTGQPVDYGMPVIHSPGPGAPLRVDVLDLLEGIDVYLAYFLPLVRGTMRLGHRTGAVSPKGGLLFLSASLGPVYAEDPVLGDDVSKGAWRLDRCAGWIFGERSRPFATPELCQDCGMQSLWVVPERMIIKCGNPACGSQRPVDAALPAHTSESGS